MATPYTSNDTLITLENLKTFKNLFKADFKSFVPSTDEKAGEMGLVPAPAIGDQIKFLKGDGTWTKINNDILDRMTIVEVIAPEGEEEGYYYVAFDDKELAYKLEVDEQIAEVKEDIKELDEKINYVASFTDITALFS